jgi:hypothetical protein
MAPPDFELMFAQLMAKMEESSSTTAKKIDALSLNAAQAAVDAQNARDESAAQIAEFRRELDELRTQARAVQTRVISSSSAPPPVQPVIPGGTGSTTLPASGSTSFTPSVDMPIAPEKVRVPTLPVLGKGTGELPYLTWSKTTRALLDASSACYVLDNPVPDSNENGALLWYTMTSKKVFAAILQAVGKVPIIGNKVLNLATNASAAQMAWEALHKFYIREADSNLPFLQKSLRELTPEQGESMESFIARCNELLRLYESYGLKLADQDLLVQVFSTLSNAWRKSLGIRGPITAMSWDDVSLALQEEDNDRAQSNTAAEDALLPLGWCRGQQRPDPIGLSEQKQAQGSANRVGGKKWGRERSAGDSPNRRSYGRSTSNGSNGQSSGRPSCIVCFKCFHIGHGVSDCPDRTSGWRLTPEAREKAYAIRDAYNGKTAKASSSGQEEAKGVPPA